MRICTTTIPFSGMSIEGFVPLEALNARLKEGSEGQEIAFEAAPKVVITLTRTLGGIMVKGSVAGTCKQDCSTCADPVNHELDIPIDWILQTSSDRAGPDDELDDPGVITYEGDNVDLEEHLQEALILQLSPFWHPPRDTRDRCTVCTRDCSVSAWQSKGAANSEKKQSLGDLLKGALNGTTKH
jgi:uncharacterized metal-binding protein YceD (DUF177 family)